MDIEIESGTLDFYKSATYGGPAPIVPEKHSPTKELNPKTRTHRHDSKKFTLGDCKALFEHAQNKK